MTKTKRNSTYIAVLSYGGLGLGYLTKGLLFPLLFSTAQVGLLNTLVLIATFFSQLASFSTSNIVFRFIPFFTRKSEGQFLKFMSRLLLFGIVFSVILFFAFRKWVEAQFIENSPLLSEFLMYSIPIGLSFVLFNYFDTYLRGILIPVPAVLIRDVIIRVLLVLAVILFWLELLSFHQFILLFCLIYVLQSVILLLYAQLNGHRPIKFLGKRINPKWRGIMIRYGALSFANGLIWSFLILIDTTMLASFQGLEVVGVYTVMLFIANAIFIPYNSILKAVTPIVSIFMKEKKEVELEKIYKKTSKISFLVTFLLSFVVFLNIELFYEIVPKDYSNGTVMLLILLICRIVDSIGGLCGYVLVLSKKIIWDFWLSLFVLLIAFILNLNLIPIYGGKGAAIATLISYILVNIIRIVLVYQLKGIHPYGKEWGWIAFFSCLLIFVGVLAVNLIDNHLGLLTVSVLGPVFFFLLLQQVGIVPKFSELKLGIKGFIQ